ncbi:CBS domain-containing protein [Halomarina litorea]|uniref:CBS domain-containing protein n=1 Tax=Halomarina litorea TaxID=2961595 RepID=UPI0020C527F4|nr:CBS domain-containing protein [Halomarina sp. BCD28]
MDVRNIVSTDYVDFSPDMPVSKLAGALDDPSVPGVVVVDDGIPTGVVTRRQLAASHRHPDAKVGSLVWHVPTVEPTTDVREVARLMLASDARLLPVAEGPHLRGVVTADDLLRAVQDALTEVTVGDAASDDLLTVEPETTVGTALNTLREHRITHLPVVEGGRAVGVLSLHDLTGVTTRAVRRSRGGVPSGFDGHGGAGSGGGYRSHGGFGAREGDRDRLLDLPVRDVMVSPARTTLPDQSLADALEEMFAIGGSSLVVVDGDEHPTGIVTKSDVLRALTREVRGNRAVQVYGVDHLDDASYDDVVAMVDGFDTANGDTAVLGARIHLHEHDERHRGTPLLLARIRLETDRGLYVVSGEGYGARAALGDAGDALRRRLREDRTYARTKKHPDADFWERRWGWLLVE